MGRLDGRVALVTGGARGLGASFAKAFIDEGAKVVITDVREDEGSRYAAELGKNARFAAQDVSNAEDWARVLEYARNEFGDVNVLVNNAGIAIQATPIDALDVEDYRKIFEVNQVGTFLGMKLVRPYMLRAGGGSIVNLSSIAGVQPDEGTMAYSASKFAVVGMTKVAAREFGPHGIRVNSLHPGVIETPLFKELRPVMAEYAQRLIDATPMRRLGQPDEVAAVVVFLASKESSFVNGASFVVDGGILK